MSLESVLRWGRSRNPQTIYPHAARKSSRKPGIFRHFSIFLREHSRDWGMEYGIRRERHCLIRFGPLSSPVYSLMRQICHFSPRSSLSPDETLPEPFPISWIVVDASAFADAQPPAFRKRRQYEARNNFRNPHLLGRGRDHP